MILRGDVVYEESESGPFTVVATIASSVVQSASSIAIGSLAAASGATLPTSTSFAT